MRVLLLGGYGNFGRLIAAELAHDAGIELIIAGRHFDSARQLADALRRPGGASIDAVAFDIQAADFVARLSALKSQLVIHTGGPFQGCDYAVAQAAIAAGAHYVDIADARAFVIGIGSLDAAARKVDRLVVSGASTVPALSAAVVDAYVAEFAQLDSIDIGISPGNRTRRGTATVAAILSYVGQRVAVWKNAHWTDVIGWQQLRHIDCAPPVGRRWLGNCDVPDLTLFATRYPGVREVRFGAGLQLVFLHFGLWLLSWPVRWGWISHLERWAKTLQRMSEWFENLGSDAGAMQVNLRGTGNDGSALKICWELIAGSGHGPQVPATAAVVLARKLARGEIAVRGAMPCMDLIRLDEFVEALRDFDVAMNVTRVRT